MNTDDVWHLIGRARLSASDPHGADAEMYDRLPRLAERYLS